MAGRDNCRAFGSTDDCETAARRSGQDKAGGQLNVQPLSARHGREVVRSPPDSELDTEC